MRARRATVLAALACVLPGLAACSDDDGTTLPPPEETSSTTTTAPIDYSQVSLQGIDPGKPPPVTRPPGPGQATVAGRVVDESGVPVPQAFVRATYYGDPDKPEVIEALSGDDGSYSFGQLFGGRWRIRAWKTPTHASLAAPVFFLGATETKSLDLRLKLVPDMVVTADMAPDPPLVGWLAELAVLVVTQTVDAEGALERTPAAGVQVSLSSPGKWSLQTPATQTTKDDGTIRWLLTCDAEGNQGMKASVRVAPPPTAPTTATPPTTDKDATTSTTKKDEKDEAPSTTGTTEKDEAPPRVPGREFTLTVPSCLSPASTTTTTTADPATTSSTRARRRATTTTAPPRSSSSTRPPIQPR